MAATFCNFVNSDSSVTLLLFQNVTNTAEIKKEVVVKQKFELALLKPSLIVDTFQVLTAVNKALHLDKCNKKYTKKLHSEIIYSLHPSKNITESFKTFGTGDSDSSILVAAIDNKDNLQEFQKLVQGEIVDINIIKDFTDIEAVKKVYKIKEPELTVGSLLDAVVGRIASKDIVTV